MLAGRKPGDALPSGLNPFDPAVTIEELFGNMSGAPLLDAILEFYGDGLVDLDWYAKDKDGSVIRSMVRSPLSRCIQEGTVQCYMKKILDDGFSQAVSGKYVFCENPNLV